jgi:hypothetical protein
LATFSRSRRPSRSRNQRGEKEEKIAATEEIDEDREPELALRIADHALQCGLKVRISSEEARNAVKRMI